MPRRCCIPNCKVNYDTTLRDHDYASTFVFPKNEELRKKWLAVIPRKNWTPTKHSALCSLHFKESDIAKYQEVVSPAGVLETVPMTRPRLMPNAVPSIFYDPPSHLKKYGPAKRKDSTECQDSKESVGKEIVKLELDSAKRKAESSHNESDEKIQKTSEGDSSIKAEIGENTNVQRTTYNIVMRKAQGSQVTDEANTQNIVDEGKITSMQKKLQIVEETVSSLSASHKAELKAKEEILQQLNGDWESSNKYYYQISESLKEFQQYKDNLSKLYNNVILKQQARIKRLQKELTALKVKEVERKSEVENTATEHDKRLQDMMVEETNLKKQLDEVKKELTLEKAQLESTRVKEELELTKEQETLESVNKDLQVQLETVVKEKQSLSDQLVERNEEISKLQDEIVVCKDKLQDLLQQNRELSSKCEEAVQKEEELRAQEVDHLDTAKEVEESITEGSDPAGSLEDVQHE